MVHRCGPAIRGRLADVRVRPMLVDRAFMTLRLVLLAAVLVSTMANPGDPEVYSGEDNSNSGASSVIMGGHLNTIDAAAVSAAVMGGEANSVESPQSVIVGGSTNYVKGATAPLQTLIGGTNNRVESKQASVVGGRTNRARARYSSVGGGYNNLVTGRFSGVAGGTSNTIQGMYGSILGNFGTVRKDSALVVNLSGVRKILAVKNTIAMWVGKLFINGHDIDEVYAGSSRRNRRLDEQLGHHVGKAAPDVVGLHASEQAAVLSNKVAELRRAVSELGDAVSRSAVAVSQSRRQLQQSEQAIADDAAEPRRTEAVAGNSWKLQSAVGTVTGPLPKQSDDEATHQFLRAYYTANDAMEQKLLSHAHGLALSPGRFLRATEEKGVQADGGAAEAAVGLQSQATHATRRWPPPLADAWKSITPLPPALRAKWQLARSARRKAERDRVVRRRLVNQNSDYPQDGTMAQVYHESITARMDDIDSRIGGITVRLFAQQDHYAGGDLVGNFDCLEQGREAYSYGPPCNMCGDAPRLQWRASNPGSGGAAVFVCDGNGVFREESLDLLSSGTWLQLV